MNFSIAVRSVRCPSRLFLHQSSLSPANTIKNNFYNEATLHSKARFLSNASIKSETTLAMIKPDGLNYTIDIKRIIVESGFNILKEISIQLDERDAELFYAEHSTRSFFPALVKYMASGPVYIMVLEKVNAIADWRALIGPTDARKAKITHPHSIRAMCGSDLERNCVHGSDSSHSASREISFFFGETVSAERHASEHDEL